MRACLACLVVTAALLIVPGWARAATAPVIVAGPVISGTAQVGEELAPVAAWTGDPAPTATWVWQRCTKPAGGCAAITDAVSERYRVVEADVGAYLRVGLKVTNSAGSKEARSKPTAAVLAAPVATPTSTPTPEPVATPEPAEPPAPDPEPVVVPVIASPLVPLAFDPFPVVRFRGELTATGARLTLLSVRAPRDVRISVDCAGRDCPARHFVSPAGKLRLRKFERGFKAGTRLEIRVTKAGYVGKFTSIVIRRHAEPRRLDRCLVPGADRPSRCAGA
ncbi:PqqD family protein [Solirubrobacter ginsenosidimutans]|uniref:PqqD family protein n=1 Tax=Solirubrobacter ginsenosidimutans TaxID=490573 RepID=A0A9X3S143_9ACTN|nr:hypothetical protein [Solirubrobacter ginsenosidimutans]MDA0159781.1 PqqD family protein [Solirubrobacter ginsenosidimutans]